MGSSSFPSISLFSFHSLLTSTYIIHFPYYNSVCIEPNICVCVCVWRYKSRGASYVWSSKVYPTVLCLCLPRCLQYFLMPSLFFSFLFSGIWEVVLVLESPSCPKKWPLEMQIKKTPHPTEFLTYREAQVLFSVLDSFYFVALFCYFTLLFRKAFRCGFRSFFSFSFLAFLSSLFS